MHVHHVKNVNTPLNSTGENTFLKFDSVSLNCSAASLSGALVGDVPVDTGVSGGDEDVLPYRMLNSPKS